MVIFRNIDDYRIYVETCLGVNQIFKTDEKITRVFECKTIEKGTYLLDARYHITVNNILVQDKIDDIIIEVR